MIAVTQNAVWKSPSAVQIAATKGPTAKPATSTAPNRPRFLPKLSGSIKIMDRFTAGAAVPRANPYMVRATMNCHNSVPTARISRDITPMTSPARSRRGDFPRSAYGPRTILANPEPKKPRAIMNPICILVKPS